MSKLAGKTVTLLPRALMENEIYCETCGGTGWVIGNTLNYITHCNDCYGTGKMKICPDCGKVIKGSFCGNPECRDKRDALEESKRVMKAKHYTLKTVPEESSYVFYSELYDYNEGYFTEDDDFLDSLKLMGIHHIWGTKASIPTFNAEDIVRTMLEESYEDAYDHVKEEELAKLQAACDEFLKAHGESLHSYYVDYNVCVDLVEEKSNEN